MFWRRLRARWSSVARFFTPFRLAGMSTVGTHRPSSEQTKVHGPNHPTAWAARVIWWWHGLAVNTGPIRRTLCCE